MKVEAMLPEEIEKRSFEMISELLGEKILDSENEDVIKRVIHTTADFDYVENLFFTQNVVRIIREAIEQGAHIVTDTNMAKAGINKNKLATFGGDVHCYMGEAEVIQKAKERNVTRAVVSMEQALSLPFPLIFAIGNAPTALLKLCDMIKNQQIKPIAVIGVPVGFVNVVESKEILVAADVPSITARGRKGGSNVAAAICNAILYK